MKKYITFPVIIMICSIIMMACSQNNDNPSQSKNVEETNSEESSSNEVLEERQSELKDKKTTSDPMDVVKDDAFEVFEGGMAKQEIIGRYITDESDENGMITLEKDGYRVSFAIILLYDPVVDEYLMQIMGEDENTNTDGGAIGIPDSEIKTNQDETLQDTFSIEYIDPGVENTFNSFIILDDDDKPLDSFDVIVKEPTEKQNAEDDQVKEWKTLEFYKQ